MISGAHAILYSKNANADRDFFKNILRLSNVDVGDGWLIFGLPPSEVAVHPTSGKSYQELYLMCDDVEKFTKQMRENKISCSEVNDYGWGLLTELTLPGGGTIGVYQPRHARPNASVKKKKTVTKKSQAKKSPAKQKRSAKK